MTARAPRSAKEQATETHRRLGLLYSDGSLTVFAEGVDVQQARREAVGCDIHEPDPAQFTKVVYVTVSVIELHEVPSLKTTPNPGKIGLREALAALLPYAKDAPPEVLKCAAKVLADAEGGHE